MSILKMAYNEIRDRLSQASSHPLGDEQDLAEFEVEQLLVDLELADTLQRVVPLNTRLDFEQDKWLFDREKVWSKTEYSRVRMLDPAMVEELGQRLPTSA